MLSHAECPTSIGREVAAACECLFQPLYLNPVHSQSLHQVARGAGASLFMVHGEVRAAENSTESQEHPGQ